MPMAKPAAKFRWRVVDEHSPKEIYNYTLFLSVFVFGVLGAARGMDEGTIAGSIYQPSFKQRFGLADKTKSASWLANRKSNITSMVQIGSVAGSLIASYLVDKIGRKRSLQSLCIIWVVGVIIQITSKDVGQLYAGRFIEGLAVGQTTTVGPSYLSEVAPPAYRGMFNCIFSGAVYFGIFIGYFANYGTALHIPLGEKQWIIPTSMKIVMAGLIFIMSLTWCIESPRWLLKVGKQEKAIQNLCKLRHLEVDHPYIISELSDIQTAIAQEKAAVEHYTFAMKWRDLLFVRSVRYRFLIIGCLSQILGQWSGANAVTIYATSLFQTVGIKGIDVLKMTAILGVVKLVGAYFAAFFLIDFLGRRRSLYLGIILQAVCLLYYAIFLTIVPAAELAKGSLTKSQHRASQGAIAAIYLSGVGWTMGFNSVQYLLGAEVMPLKLRSFAQSIIMVLHFANQYGNSKALPNMMIAMKSYGAFYFFVAVLCVALFWCWFFIPEVSGRSLESMEEVFNLPWYLVGRKGAIMCPDLSQVNHIAPQVTHQTLEKVEEIYIENVAAAEEAAQNASASDDDDDDEEKKEQEQRQNAGNLA
ncbi:uncharacterized protein KQ657_000036 [Scheffersomyces spartinae]|uniref:Major facilitator superfamily (MFS) profile domain-containing protein n=1 Tax=Scheffersomyces spartinae TaxID=45513 RepID=A0A9P7VDW5_9ASCO|nr:uncharacterized protein KQ657_000036 [Scheffersomyces spartinae]KAG7196029.1 hypothetical protein KQ657_000036 [Scheffersomyces spartinae]